MMKMKYLKFFFIFLVSAATVGCASMPDATISYYLPESKVEITAIQTVSCADTSKPIVKTDVSFNPVYFANLTKRKTIDFSKLDTFYSSGDAEVTLTEDGRLSSFNTTSTGKGEDVIDIIISVAGIVAVAPSNTVAACTVVNQIAGKTGAVQNPLTVEISSIVTFSGTSLASVINATPFEIKEYPNSIYTSIVPVLGKLSFSHNPPNIIKASVVTKQNTDHSLTLVEPAIVDLKVIRTDFVTNKKTTFSGNVHVPQLGAEFIVPIPQPPVFGENVFKLSLFESGRIKSLKYGSTNGAKDAGAALSKIYGQFDSQTDQEKAAELKAKADVMAQQQRIVICESTPSLCK